MKVKVNFKNMGRIPLWFGLGILLVAIGFMSAFPGLIVTVLPLLTLLLLPFAVLGVFLYAEGNSLNQPLRHTRINPWQPTEPPSKELTPEFELAGLNAKLASLRSEEKELENEIELLAGQETQPARV
jgi:hypothetical protein